MALRPESFISRLLRCEVLAVQGVVRAVLFFVLGVVSIPLVPFLVVISRWRVGDIPAWKALLLTPLWFAMGVLIAVWSPFEGFWDDLQMTRLIVRSEWGNVFMVGDPKKPDGSQPTIREGSEGTDT